MPRTIPKLVGDMVGYVDHLSIDIHRALSSTVCLPKKKPSLEMFFSKAAWQVLHRHGAGEHDVEL